MVGRVFVDFINKMDVMWMKMVLMVVCCVEIIEYVEGKFSVGCVICCFRIKGLFVVLVVEWNGFLFEIIED